VRKEGEKSMSETPLTEGTQTAIQDVIAERNRQKSQKGWTSEHDDEHDSGELATAAACYALPDEKREIRPFNVVRDIGRSVGESILITGVDVVPRLWPWDAEWWKPKDRRRDLVRAAALLIAEIERIDRSKGGASSSKVLESNTLPCAN
jgi:hypothetical protein